MSYCSVCAVLISLLYSLSSFATTARTPISVMAYHDKPPYMVDIESEQGLYFDFIRFLNDRSSDYQFSLQYLPRNRVKQAIKAAPFNGVILGVNPLWFEDPEQIKFFWTGAVFHDEDIFVSAQLTPFEYIDGNSLFGKQVCLVLGNYYAGITEEVASLRLSLLHTSREVAIFDLLDQDRCDFGIVSRSNYQYRLMHKDIEDKYYVSKQVHDKFDRMVLVARSQLPVYLFIEEALKKWPPEGGQK